MQALQIIMIFLRPKVLDFIQPQMKVQRPQKIPRIPIKGFSFWNILMRTMIQQTSDPIPPTASKAIPIANITVIFL
jgi:hypothetical protein